MLKLKPLTQATLLAFVMAGTAYAAAPGGAVLQHQINATYQDSEGNNYTAASNVVEISVREVRAATLASGAGAAQSRNPSAGSQIYSSHILTNTGNVTETYSLTAANVIDGSDTIDGDNLAIYVDANNNGQLDSGENAVTEVTVDAGQSVELLVESMQPSGVAAGDTMSITLDATDSQGNAATSQNTVNVTFSSDFESLNSSNTPIVWNQSEGGNCNAYVLVETGSNSSTWTEAKAAAESMSYMGVSGHLATLTTEEESNFAFNAVNGGNNIRAWFGLHRPNGGVAGEPTTGWEWITGESVDFTNWMTNAPSANAVDHNYGIFWLGAGNAWGHTLNETRYEMDYMVEFDLPCGTGTPDLSIALESAADAACDGTPDAAFDTTQLSDMEPGQCAILRTRATNEGSDTAVNAVLDYEMPNFTDYVPNTMKVDGVAMTDAEGDDAATFDDANGKLLFNVGDLDAGATSVDAEFAIKVEE